MELIKIMNKNFKQASISVSEENVTGAKGLLGKYTKDITLVGNGDQTIVRGPIDDAESTHLTNTVSYENQAAGTEVPLYKLDIQ